MIPAFDRNGNLPPGVHRATWEDLSERFGSTPRRRRLLAGLKLAVDALRRAGCRRIYVDGSFVTNKRAPGDFDAAWEPEGVDLRLLRRLEPALFDFAESRARQKLRFQGELFPSSATADLVGTTFLDFFQTDKDRGGPKGIVAIDLN